mmetsp:Transcript_10164/g.18525  ORF Transcript_10164/g.18525 Transcript_10164/m.18525 type:complete len:265 (-) Transcript_10164:279-1073(-)
MRHEIEVIVEARKWRLGQRSPADFSQHLADAKLQRCRRLALKQVADETPLECPDLHQNVAHLTARDRREASCRAANQLLHAASQVVPLGEAALHQPWVALDPQLPLEPELAEPFKEPLAARQRWLCSCRLARRLASSFGGPKLPPKSSRQLQRHLLQSVSPRSWGRELARVPENAHGLLTKCPEALLILQVGEHRLVGSPTALEGLILDLLQLWGHGLVLLCVRILFCLGLDLLRGVQELLHGAPHLQDVAIVRPLLKLAPANI